MIEVFPTPWSPRKTSLYFARGEMFGALVEGALAGADAPASADADMIDEVELNLLPIDLLEN
jgi:hypothetical protein